MSEAADDEDFIFVPSDQSDHLESEFEHERKSTETHNSGPLRYMCKI